uniref:Uncharacterized protein n=1 Tax=Anguilla anguilla TaxID=7936 RepID=A0A0E9QVJ7_ANGAN
MLFSAVIVPKSSHCYRLIVKIRIKLSSY